MSDLRRISFNPRHTFEMVEECVRLDGQSATYDFELTDDLNLNVEGVDYRTPNQGGWLMFDFGCN